MRRVRVLRVEASYVDRAYSSSSLQVPYVLWSVPDLETSLPLLPLLPSKSEPYFCSSNFRLFAGLLSSPPAAGMYALKLINKS
jgi:hypothetical protein